MPQSNSRSRSLQRGSRSGSVKRGQQASTTRRLSDLQERPAWDATSSNLDKFKLSSEEQERRKASRVSKNRPLATAESKRSFVEAWAHHVTSGGSLHADTEPDQDRQRSNSIARDLHGINYGNVVEMLRKSPASSGAATSAIAARVSPPYMAGSADTQQPHRRPIATAGPLGSVASGSHEAADDRPYDTASSTHPLVAERSAPPLLLSTVSSVSAAATAATGRSSGRSAAGAVTGNDPGGRTARVVLATATGNRSARSSASAAVTAKGQGEAEAVDEAGGGRGIPSYGGEVSITPATLRPRFNPADATTIISFGGDSEDGDDNGDDAMCSNSRNPGYSPAGAVPSAEAAARGRVARGNTGQTDPVTAGFEAVLLNRGGKGDAAKDFGSNITLAWTTSREAASPFDAAASDVERRLQAVEAALGLSARGLAGSGSGNSNQLMVQDEVADLRREVRQVQRDNTKLRQELSTFSTHASALMTQLQAQLQQLLRGSGGGAGASDIGRAASISAAEMPSLPSARPQSAAAAPNPLPAASIPTTVAAAHSNHALSGDLFVSHPVPSRPYQVVPQLDQASTDQASLSHARRNIFADLDISSLRPMGPSAPIAGARNGDGVAASATTPHAPTYRGPAEGCTPPAAAMASPLIDISSVPSASYKAPVRDIDDAEVALPSFAAFRRSAGTLAFTAARPPASGTNSVSLNPHQPLNVATPTYSAAAPESLRRSPPGPHSNTAAVQPRSFPTQYQPRAIGGVIVRPGSNLNPTASVPLPPATVVGMTAVAATGGANVVGGAYVSALASSATTAVATGSDAAAAALARMHSGLPQPLVFSLGPEFRTARATGLSADNSMSLSAHTAAATSLRSRTSVPAGGGAR